MGASRVKDREGRDHREDEPEAVVAWLADVRHEAQERSAEEARSFAQGVEDNPELAGEIEAATIAYQQETGYSAYRPTVVHQTQVYVRPYSYWVGYPWWYDVSYGYYAPCYYWYPRTYWAFGSVYFGPRLLVSFGVPHGGFWGWFFHRPIHHHHYPLETHHVVQHYDRHIVNRQSRYRHDRHRVRPHHAAAHAVSRFRRDAARPKHERGERRARKLEEREPRATGGGFARRVPPQRVAETERRLDRPKPRLAERRQPSERVRATRIARAEPAVRSNKPQRGAEAKQRPASQHRFDERRPKRTQQQARPAPRAPEPRHVQPERPRRVQNERAQPKAREHVKREHGKAVNRVNARRGGSRRSAR